MVEQLGMTCQTCAHCDTSEAVVNVFLKPTLLQAGFCTRAGGWFNGKPVPAWLQGCPDHEPIAQAQGDGDPGLSDSETAA